MNDDSMTKFEFMCEDLFNRPRYIKYLHPFNIEIILNCIEPNLTKQKLCEKLNNKKLRENKFTIYRLKTWLTKINARLYTLDDAARIFGIDKDIKMATQSELQKIVDDYNQNQGEL